MKKVSTLLGVVLLCASCSAPVSRFQSFAGGAWYQVPLCIDRPVLLNARCR